MKPLKHVTRYFNSLTRPYRVFVTAFTRANMKLFVFPIIRSIKGYMRLIERERTRIEVKEAMEEYEPPTEHLER